MLKVVSKNAVVQTKRCTDWDIYKYKQQQFFYNISRNTQLTNFFYNISRNTQSTNVTPTSCFTQTCTYICFYVEMTTIILFTFSIVMIWKQMQQKSGINQRYASLDRIVNECALVHDVKCQGAKSINF
ncbi:hypothetical protein Tsp_02621 [Trichinella spiralis]|uniref:hypothetical protein n=1 Tax=Trichinella spiralis TaxID=6334 RepID=UPI0001EFBBA9|nr:hypothetical protein Tsp_02621 [Trichinella spiralis]